jgi:4-aminobutyrate aminotransferase-like enzyme
MKNPANLESQNIYDYVKEKGLIFQIRGVRELKNVSRLMPPMTSTREEVDQALSILYDASSRLKKCGSKRKTKAGK